MPLIDVKKSYVSISGTEIPTLIDKSPGLRVYDATSPAIKENNIFFDILTGKELLNGLKYIPKLLKLNFFKRGGEIITSGIQHGTKEHWSTMLNVAKKFADEGNTVYLNKSINTALGKKIKGIGRWWPDIISISKKGVINLTEVISPSQTAKQMISKVGKMAEVLTKEGYKVITNVLTETGEYIK